MNIKVQRQKQEGSQSLIYRFNQSVKRSGLLLEARKRRFVQRRKSKNLKRKDAILKEQKRKEYKKLKKLGKIK
ncbi:MAG: hypothetical protein CO144_00965 [Candidatus Nealsonbacteria bacterium CG_4_9_14_3_um_filter_35_11]|uniref:30S ribosomal protein S21 n=2 Tax=Candidatus Nealsoniibacteriota TaxID=1817911 RepID=A0A2M7DAH3_9BACT|nr:MAG: hypothetical protein COV62_01705 [Candidatus Nealsonbacteria bacterium CG11_big_fil_rev_8_21_14_0_20_35_11]PIV45475.1 MAG: hypothetical protein COS24_02095 [Candidatus Nealsonbacteria bacterium CG02_land_8_20_14_3_00_34_20]PIZ89736.1 MAG: hypothetical protein COX88_02225 [Candidatus Nealsonbacteria bacterium CG_4_10_14_0_2_um_filter_35_20]PJA84666.1 MAG: hypothetical protein CO144_00965 [Candidatus Nealsonbacteria bacterium CG_4_9_14_3_um_filter_35_11]